ncbi:MAG: 2Fe-2S iron-sulfur cluster binding domain-containing protein [Treponema sp.]|nr:2Fe-2S iron-sulfur cluster binding domain-containing protein [Treponema sp.]
MWLTSFLKTGPRAVLSAPSGRKYRITVKDTGKVFDCADDEVVFHRMIHNRAGLKNHGCCGGGCGICRMRVVSGKWRQFKTMSAAHINEKDIKNGVVLVCCVQPRSDMVVARV